jgi:hypothetical protein
VEISVVDAPLQQASMAAMEHALQLTNTPLESAEIQ